MKINQRDIVEIAFYTGSKPEVHPAIVVSVDDIFEIEGFFYAVLLSTKNIFPDFTFEVTPNMISKPRNEKVGYAVCHMIQQFYPEDVVSRTGASLKLETFEQVITKIQNVVFGL